MTDLAVVQPCIAVVGEGRLCQAPCAPGRVRCPEHADRSDARAAAQVLEAARTRVLLRLEEKADGLAETLVELANDGEVGPSVRLDALQTAFKLLGMDKLQVSVETRDLTPGKASRDLRLLELLEKAGGEDRAREVRTALGVIETTTTDG